MIGDFVNIWAEEHGNILEKVHIRLDSFKDYFRSRGIYYSNVPCRMNNGQVIETVQRTEDIHRRFSTLDIAESYLKLTFEEFTEKYPKYKGKARFGKIFYIDGRQFTND